MQDGNDDLVLLDRWCGGDNSAGSMLFRRHLPSVCRFFANKIDGEIDDFVQETFLACVRQRHKFQRQCTFRTYLFAIARHLLYAHWRKVAHRGASVDFDERSIASLSTSVGGRLVRSDDHARLLGALRELPLEQQLLLELHYWEELERDQLAEVFEIEPATTRSRLFRARQALREQLGAMSQPQLCPASDEALDAWARSLRPSVEEVRNAASARRTTRA